MRRPLIVVLAVLLTLGASLPSALAEPTGDFDTEAGHFFPTSDVLVEGSGKVGFELSNSGGIPFWDSYQKMGGSKQLGNPISNRFDWHGKTSQVLQKGVMQWDAGGKQVVMMNTMDLFAVSGVEDWLRRTYLVPPLMDQSGEAGLTFGQIMQRRMALLEPNANIAALYRDAADPLLIYGLPSSKVTDVDSAFALRTQRNVLYFWKSTTPLGKAGTTTAGNPGEMLKASGMVGMDVFQPQPAPAPARAQAASRSGEREYRGTGDIVYGTATWYGPGFHGGITRYGEIYDMYDPTTCAANTYAYNTRLRITALSNGKSIVVRVNNTGGFRYPILVDLSYAAFAKLAHPDAGVLKVSVEVVK